MDDQLYFFEVLVDNIYFEEAVQTIPTKKNIVVTVNLGNIVTLEIRSGSLPSVGEGPMKRFVDFKAGRSYLCSMSSLKLLNVIQKENVIVTVGVRDDVKPIGTSNLPWDDTFKEMVQASIETREFVTPALIYDNLALLEDGTIKGNIQTYLRLSCFGNEIQTHFDVLQESGNTQFIFKSPNVASTFVCSKYNPGEQSSDFIPLGPLYNALTLRPDTHDRASSVMPQSTSMTALMDKKYSQARESVMSEIVYSDFFNMPAATMKESANTFDIVSLRFRPEDDRFLDFLTGKKLADLDLASVQKFSVADNLDERLVLRLRGGGLSKSPIIECQEIMDQFDRILEEYRKALSPCGHVTCNYTPNVTQETCRRTCNINAEANNLNGCGFSQCPYALYKSGLMQIDEDVEKQFVGPAIIGTCGHPKCSYRADPILPPIHWDCPEPLPVGKCKNPNCPYPQPNLGNFDRVSSTKGPCGSDMCPYALPSPCPADNCPLKSLPPCINETRVPYNTSAGSTSVSSSPNRKKKHKKSDDGGRERCPFDNPPKIVNMMFCDNPTCENLPKARSQMFEEGCETKPTTCQNPDCPQKKLASRSMTCYNPECPRRKSKTECPFANNSDENSPVKTSNDSNETVSVCSNSKDSPSGSIHETCQNPDCPFNAPSLEACQNPDCPFRQPSIEESSGTCDNPDCPYRKSSSMGTNSEESQCECDNPFCPSKRETCLNPNCPFNLRGCDVCTNPDCPNKKYAVGKQMDVCMTPRGSFNEFCGDKTCDFFDKKDNKEKTASGELDAEGRSYMRIGDMMIEKGDLERESAYRPSFYDMAPCNLRTCDYMGGLLKCVDCGTGTDGKRRRPCPKTCPGDPVCPLATAIKAKRFQQRMRTTYQRTCRKIKNRTKMRYGSLAGDDTSQYPGFKIGHRECVMPFFTVPPRMGWLWNIHTPCMTLKPRRGWRPGAITRTVAKLIMRHRKEQNLGSPLEEKRARKRKNAEDDESEMICPKPTLEIKKREGIYHITMNPLKDPELVDMNENPYLDCTPLQFKVAKNNRDDPDILCQDEGEFYKNDSSSDDELDIEVTSPAGIIHPDRPTHKKDVLTKQTQFLESDIPPTPVRKVVKPKSQEGKSKKGGKGGKKKKK